MNTGLILLIQELINSILLKERKLAPFITELSSAVSEEYSLTLQKVRLRKKNRQQTITSNVFLEAGLYTLTVYIQESINKVLIYTFDVEIIDIPTPPSPPPPPPAPDVVTLDPQFKTHSLNLEIKKGESAQVAISITNFELDLRGSLVFTEVRKLSPGYNLIEGFTGTATEGSPVIQIKSYYPNLSKLEILKKIPVRVGDFITLEGSGIFRSRALAVTSSQIVASENAERDVDEGFLLVRSISYSSFRSVPYSPSANITVISSAIAGDTILNVNGVTFDIPKDTVLLFNNGAIAVLDADLKATSVVAKVKPLLGDINNGSIAKVGVETVIVTSAASANSTTLAIAPLAIPIPEGTKLNLAIRSTSIDGDGWSYLGAATLSATALTGSTTLAVEPLETDIPPGAIAWFSPIPFNSFFLVIDPADTQFLESGEYGYDVIIRQSDGFTIRVIQGNITLSDHWSQA